MGRANMLKAVDWTRRELDRLNLDLAEYRLIHGMSPELVTVYQHMGNLSRLLDQATRLTKGLEGSLASVPHLQGWLDDGLEC